MGDEAVPLTRVEQAGSLVPTRLGDKPEGEMLVYSASVKGYEKTMTLLVDSGASQNFVSKSALMRSPKEWERLTREGKREAMLVRLADGSTVRSDGALMELAFTFCDFRCADTFVVLEMGQKYDLIVGMPWLARHQPWIDWRTRTIGSSTPSSDESERRRREMFLAAESAASTKTNTRDCKVDVAKLAGPDHPAAGRPSVSAVAASPAEERADDAAPVRARSHEDQDSEHDDSSSDANSDVSVASARDSTMSTLMRERGVDAPPKMNKRGRLKKSVRGRSSVASRVEEGPSSHANAVAPAPQRAQDDADAKSDAYAEFALLHGLPTDPEETLSLEEMSYELFLSDAKRGEIVEIAVPTVLAHVEANTSSAADESVLETEKQKRFNAQDWDALKSSPYYDVLWKYREVFPEKMPSALPMDRGVRHEIDLDPGTKYCVTRQWPLPREQVAAIDDFFAKRHAAGHVRESKSPHSSPTFCVRKATGGWRIVHAYNKLNAATIPAQTPIPRKDVMLDSMGGSTVFSALDLTDGFYQILMRESDAPLTAVSTPSGMLWEWLVMPQGLRNAPATFNRLVTHLLRPHRAYAPSYFDDIFVHSRAEGEVSEVDVHKRHLAAVLQCLQDNRLYCNLRKCIFGAREIPILGCYVGADGVRADPEKIKAVADWPTPRNVKDLRKWLGLANYLHKYSQGYAALVRPLTQLLKKDVDWVWSDDAATAFEDVKTSLTSAPILALPNHAKPFSVVCDASDFAIGSALMQKDDDGNDRVIAYQSRLLKAAERNYPVHDKELLSIKYALLKYRVHLLGATPFVVFTDHASLRTAVNSPHLSQRMARWLSFFAEFNFRVEYKPGRENVLADALSRRPDFEDEAQQQPELTCLESDAELMHASISRVQVRLTDAIAEHYDKDNDCRLLIAHFDGTSKEPLPAKLAAKLARYSYRDGLLWHQLSEFDYPRVCVPHDQDLKLMILHELHDAPASGHLGREKTFLQVSNVFWWPHLYKWVANYVRACEQCQRVKPAGKSRAPLQPLPIPQDCWKSVSMDFIFGFPEDNARNVGVVVFVDRLSKMVHLAPVRKSVTAAETASIFLEHVFRLHGLPVSIVSDRDPRFTAAFWRELFRLLKTDLAMSTADHPETDGQTERVNRVVEDIIRSIAVDHPRDWSHWLPFAEFAVNNSVHASTGVTPFFFNNMRHPRVPATMFDGVERSAVGGHDVTPAQTAADGASESHDVLDAESLSRDARDDIGVAQERDASAHDDAAAAVVALDTPSVASALLLRDRIATINARSRDGVRTHVAEDSHSSDTTVDASRSSSLSPVASDTWSTRATQGSSSMKSSSLAALPVDKQSARRASRRSKAVVDTNGSSASTMRVSRQASSLSVEQTTRGDRLFEPVTTTEPYNDKSHLKKGTGIQSIAHETLNPVSEIQSIDFDTLRTVTGIQSVTRETMKVQDEPITQNGSVRSGRNNVELQATTTTARPKSTKQVQKAVASAQLFVDERAAMLRRVRDQLASAQDRQKFYADRQGRKNREDFNVGDQVLLSVRNLPNDLVTALPSGSKLLPRYIGPFNVTEKIGALNYRLDLPTQLRTHPVFYVGVLKRYRDFIPPDGRRPTTPSARRPGEGRQSCQASRRDPTGHAHEAHSARRRDARSELQQSPDRQPNASDRQGRPSRGASRRLSHPAPGTHRRAAVATRAARSPSQRGEPRGRRSRDQHSAGSRPTSEQQQQPAQRQTSMSSPKAQQQLARRLAREPLLPSRQSSQRPALLRTESPRMAHAARHSHRMARESPRTVDLREHDDRHATDRGLHSPGPNHSHRGRAPPMPLTDRHGSLHYHVERLLRRERRHGHDHFLVQWRGFDQPTWEPADRLSQDVPDLVEAFARREAASGSRRACGVAHRA